MPNIIIEIPDEKIQLVKDWVDSRTNAGIVEGWSDAQYAAYVDSYITSHFGRSLCWFHLRSPI